MNIDEKSVRQIIYKDHTWSHCPQSMKFKTANFPSPYLLHLPKFYPASSLPLPEGRAGYFLGKVRNSTTSLFPLCNNKQGSASHYFSLPAFPRLFSFFYFSVQSAEDVTVAQRNTITGGSESKSVLSQISDAFAKTIKPVITSAKSVCTFSCLSVIMGHLGSSWVHFCEYIYIYIYTCSRRYIFIGEWAG